MDPAAGSTGAHTGKRCDAVVLAHPLNFSKSRARINPTQPPKSLGIAGRTIMKERSQSQGRSRDFSAGDESSPFDDVLSQSLALSWCAGQTDIHTPTSHPKRCKTAVPL